MKTECSWMWQCSQTRGSIAAVATVAVSQLLPQWLYCGCSYNGCIAAVASLCFAAVVTVAVLRL